MIITVTPNISLDKTLIVDGIFEIGKTHRVKDITFVPGGKGVNASRALLGLGYKAPVLGFLGGNTGNHIKSIFKYEGIVEDTVWIEGETRTCYNIVDVIKNTQTEVLERGPAITREDIDLLKDKISKYLSEYTIVCMGGSLPQGAPEDLYSELVELVKSKGGRVILDTSGKALMKGIDAGPFAVKPNKAEVEAILNINLDPKNVGNIKNALDYFSNKGIELSVISMGKDGLFASYKGNYYKVTPPVLDPLNAVGSGDSTVAGIALGLEQNLKIEEVLRLGVAMGTANVLTLKPGDVRKSDVEDILPRVEVTVI